MTNPKKTISLHHCIADGRETLCFEACALASVVTGVFRSHLSPPRTPLVPGVGKGWGEEGGQRGLTDGDFCFTTRGRCTLAPGKGGELGGGVGRELYLQAPKVTIGEKRKVANCHASPVLPEAELKCLQAAASRWEAPLSGGRRT